MKGADRSVKAGRGRRVLMLLQNCSYPRDPRVRREARTLIEAGFRVSVIAPSSPGLAGRETLEGVRVYRYPEPRPASGFLGYVWEYAYSLGAVFMISLGIKLGEGFDIVHAHHPPDAFALIGAFYKLFGARFVMDHHDLAPELYDARFRGRGNRAVRMALVLLERLSCRLADRVIATNESYKHVEMKRGRVPEKRITIVRNGPDLGELHPADPPPGLRERASIVVGYVGVTGIQDGVEHLLWAVRHLKADLGRTGFVCVIVGSGAALKDLKALALRLDLAAEVVFTGWVDRQADVSRWLSGMDICVAPEPADAFNVRSTAVKIMEYMSLGKPVVAFDLPEHRFSAGDAAVYARPGDDLDLAVKISGLMDDPALRRDMGRLGRERVANELSWQCQKRALAGMYEALVRDAAPRSPKKKLVGWLNPRPPRYVMNRGLTVGKRYGITPSRAQDRILKCLETLALDGCATTLPTPGAVVDRHPSFIRRLQDMSTEIAVHGYHHIDFRTYTPAQGVSQLKKAIAAFERHSIDVRGFRCPYLSYSEELAEALPRGLFQYGSNSSIRREGGQAASRPEANLILETIYGLYRPRDAAEVVSIPWIRRDLVEIPVSVPDDLQLHDGMRLDEEGLSGVWTQWLVRTHEREELLNLMFHPELANVCLGPLARVVREARRLRPSVWIARLRDISDWWREKSAFRSSVAEASSGLRVSFQCSPRATILAKGISSGGAAGPWDGLYERREAESLDVPATPRPFVGVAEDVPESVTSFLQNRGYILESGELAPRCSVFLNAERAKRVPSQAGLLSWIEGRPGPLVRYGPWPDGAKSALCISGDLDALTLRDYVSRLFSG